MKPHLDMDRIARGLGADRKGKVSAAGGYLGALQLLAHIGSRLEALTERVRTRSGVNVEPMQLAALLLEKTAERLSDEEIKGLVAERRRSGR